MAQNGRKGEPRSSQLRRIHHLLSTLCGLYSRVAARLNRDRSYVSRVARGVRRSKEVESALISEFDRVQREHGR